MKWTLVVLVQAIFPIGPAMTSAEGQPLSVYSEFARIDAQGNVAAPETPREILSPAVVRNGFTSFQVVVQVPMGTPYVLRIGQNPDNAAKVTFYRSRVAGASAPDDVRIKGVAEPVAEPINGDATQIFWMDVWTEKDAPVRRIKVEPQLWIDGDWVIYPIEMRVRESVVPEVRPRLSSNVTASPFDLLRGYLCDGKRTESSPADTVSGDWRATAVDDMRTRNARQDLALASLLPMPGLDELRKRMGGCNARASENPESYLNLRDYLFAPLGTKAAPAN